MSRIRIKRGRKPRKSKELVQAGRNMLALHNQLKRLGLSDQEVAKAMLMPSERRMRWARELAASRGHLRPERLRTLPGKLRRAESLDEAVELVLVASDAFPTTVAGAEALQFAYPEPFDDFLVPDILEAGRRVRAKLECDSAKPDTRTEDAFEGPRADHVLVDAPTEGEAMRQLAESLGIRWEDVLERAQASLETTRAVLSTMVHETLRATYTTTQLQDRVTAHTGKPCGDKNKARVARKLTGILFERAGESS